MRWIFLFFAALNLFYYVWHQQQVPLQIRESTSSVEKVLGRNKIRLLGEEEIIPAQQRAAFSSEKTEAQCLFLGELEEKVDAVDIQQRLTALSLSSNVSIMHDVGNVEYEVYLEPMGSEQASRRQLKELQARRIVSYLIGEGALAGGIFLGSFPLRASAEGLEERLRAAGYAPSIRAVQRDQRSFWVKIDPGGPQLWDGILQQLTANYPSLQHRMMPCQSELSALGLK